MKSIIPHGSSHNGERWHVRTEAGAPVGTSIRVASGFGSRLRGLLGSRALPEGHGLLLVPCQSIHMFFMSIALDVAFLDAQGRVVAVYAGLKPWRLSRLHPEAFAALELPAGTLEKCQVKKGDRLVFASSTTE
ncbi:MAG: hypothetical protein CVU65_05985 [Deltaproteobacteria bacterium HGW-Deltaproteobacteria-22]|nr:MAG: hypothetical protein CVU65_05985 [Deltaproteobacteria bacterium HGW-Deltaproteobacteria-22]